MTTADEDMARVARLVGGSLPSSMRNHLVEANFGVAYIAGSATRWIGSADYAQRPSGLSVPARLTSPRPIDFVGTYVTSDEYLPLPAGSVKTVVMRTQRPVDLLRELAFLAHVERNDGLLKTFAADYLRCLADEPKKRLRVLLGPRHRRLMARQPILAAMMLCLQWVAKHGEVPLDERALPPRIAALALSQAVGQTLGTEQREVLEAGGPSATRAFMIELAQNGQFNRSDDALSQLLRCDSLWRQYLPAAQGSRDQNADAALVGATGLSQLLTRYGGLPGDPAKVEAFLRGASATMDGLSVAAAAASGDWSFLPLMQHPILDLGERGLLVLDEALLLDRVTTGLRRYVDESAGEPNTPTRTRWDQHFAKAVELMAKDAVTSLAPLRLREAGEVFAFDEDDLKPFAKKRADISVCYGESWCVFEIVSKRMTARTLLDGDMLAFEKDVSDLVFEKAEQLDCTGHALLAGAAAKLTGIPGSPVVVFPIVVCPEGFPNGPLVAEYVRKGLVDRHLFADARFAPLAVLDLRDLELLETLIEHGIMPSEAMRRWHASGLATLPFVNFVWHTYRGRLKSVRPTRYEAQSEQFFAGIGGVLGIQLPDISDTD